MDSFSYIAPSNKFSQPLFDDTQLLSRHNLIREYFPQSLSSKKIIILEAQAGQGKTTFAYQTLHYFNQQGLWYQLDQEDNDPFFFLTALHECFVHTFPNFKSHQLIKILTVGNVGPLDVMRCANILLNDISKFLKADTFLILEDLHRIDTTSLMGKLLSYIFDTSPPTLRFFITTRSPISFPSKSLMNKATVSYLFTEDLAFKEDDTKALLTNILRHDVGPADTLKIQQITKGWVMGIILASHPSSQNKLGRISFPENVRLSPAISHTQLLNYFQNEIFTHLPENLHTPFLQLSFLSEIPTELAEIITTNSNIEELLFEMVEDNYFLTALEEDHNTFRFHQLFQEFLQLKAREIITEEDIKQIFCLEAEYYFGKKRISKGLECYLKGEEYEKINTTLQKDGLKLLAQNKTLALYNLMKKVPEQTLFKYEWLTLTTGVILGDFAPKTSLPFLTASRKMFLKKGNEIGELIALAQTIYYHFVVSGLYNHGRKLLAHTELLLQQNEDRLDDKVQIMVLRNLAAGHCFFTANMDKARMFANRANDIASSQKLNNFIASSQFIIGYIELLSGNFSQFLKSAESCFSLINDPLVGTSNKLTMRIMHLCYLSMVGDKINFTEQKNSLLSNIDQDVIKQTVAAPYLHLWNSIIDISYGKLDNAENGLRIGEQISSTAESEHMKSQFLQWQGFTESFHETDKDSVEYKIDHARKLRDIAGGPFYECLNLIVQGATETQLGNHNEALDTLRIALTKADSLSLTYLSACSQCHIINLYLLLGDVTNTKKQVKSCFDLMIKCNYQNLWGVTPELIHNILNFCIDNSFEIQPAKTIFKKTSATAIAQKQLFPLLEFTLLDSFCVRYQNDEKLIIDDFTQQQRQLLGLLLASPENKVSIETVLISIWPYSAPGKARKSFDTVLERLRKCFSDKLDIPIKKYITVNKGILSLNYHQVDCNIVIENITLGCQAAKRGKWWQAINHFTIVNSLWGNTLPTTHFPYDMTIHMEEKLTTALGEMTTLWSEFLFQNGLYNESATLLEKMWLIDEINEDIISTLYGIYTVTNNNQKCWQTLERYCEILAKYEFEQGEIDERRNEIIEKHLT